MAKKNEAQENAEVERRMTPEIQKSIDDIIYQQKQIARDKEALTEAVAAVAEKLGIKAGVLNRRISIIIKEEEKGGEIKSKEDDIDFSQQYFTIKSNSEH